MSSTTFLQYLTASSRSEGSTCVVANACAQYEPQQYPYTFELESRTDGIERDIVCYGMQWQRGCHEIRAEAAILPSCRAGPRDPGRFEVLQACEALKAVVHLLTSKSSSLPLCKLHSSESAEMHSSRPRAPAALAEQNVSSKSSLNLRSPLKRHQSCSAHLLQNTGAVSPSFGFMLSFLA